MSEMNEFIERLSEFFGESCTEELHTFLGELDGRLQILESKISEFELGKQDTLFSRPELVARLENLSN